MVWLANTEVPSVVTLDAMPHMLKYLLNMDMTCKGLFFQILNKLSQPMYLHTIVR